MSVVFFKAVPKAVAAGFTLAEAAKAFTIAASAVNAVCILRDAVDRIVDR